MPSPDHAIHEALVRLESKLDSVQEDLHTLSTLVTGNGDPENSLILKVDRLSQDSKRREVWSQAAIGAAITAFVTAVGAAIWPHAKG